jgi:hypothetical protein
MLALCALEHFIIAGITVACEVSDIGDVHDALYIKTCEAEILFKNILHDIASEVADMSKMIHGRTAGIHTHPASLIRDEFLFFV